MTDETVRYHMSGRMARIHFVNTVDFSLSEINSYPMGDFVFDMEAKKLWISVGVHGMWVAAGIDGSPGSIGAVGAQGGVGPAGSLGPTGPSGSTGPTGPQGTIGVPGGPGPTGSPGSTGPSGPASTYTLPACTKTALGGVKLVDSPADLGILSILGQVVTGINSTNAALRAAGIFGPAP